MLHATVRMADLADEWRVEVTPMISLKLAEGTGGKSFAARLFQRDAGKRWVEVSVSVLNDESPLLAISDLLDALDAGMLLKKGGRVRKQSHAEAANR